MTVQFGERFERMMADLIAGGRFQSRSEVIRAGLRLLEECEYGAGEPLEAELSKRLKSPAQSWAKSDLSKIRRLGRAKRKRHSKGRH